MRNQGLVVSLLILAACLLALLSQSIRVCLLVNKSRLCLWRDWGDFERWEREQRKDKRRCVQEEKEKVERDTEAWEVIRAMFTTNRLYAACAVATVQTNRAAGMCEREKLWAPGEHDKCMHRRQMWCDSAAVDCLSKKTKLHTCVSTVLEMQCTSMQCCIVWCTDLAVGSAVNILVLTRYLTWSVFNHFIFYFFLTANCIQMVKAAYDFFPHIKQAHLNTWLKCAAKIRRMLT